ncbi:MAG: amino acid ABC transporter substrate-binding protein [Bdellovibrionales bacterium]|nr:amino acid ABC transporter substrate-binding protein [Bdellovibrionales bacterium]
MAASLIVRRIKFLALLVSGLALAQGALGQSVKPRPGSLEAASDIQRIVQNKKLRISLHVEDSFPFFYKNEKKELVGLDIWLGQQIAAKLGVEVQWIREGKTFEDVLRLVTQRKADIAISALFITLDRAKSLRFTDPYWNVKPVLVLNRVKSKLSGRSDPDVLSSLGRTKIPIGLFHSGFLTLRTEHRYPEADLRYFHSRKQMLPALQKGELTAAFIDEIELQKWRESMRDFDLYFRSVEDSAGPLPLSIAVHPHDLQLHYWLNTYLSVLRADGVVDRHLQLHSKVSP